MNNPCTSTFSCHALSVSDKRSESCPRFEQPGVPVFMVLYPQSWTPCSGSFPIKPLHLRTRLPGEAGSNTHQHHWVSYTPGHHWTWPWAATLPMGCKKQAMMHFPMEMLPFDLYLYRLLFLQGCYCMCCLYYICSLWNHGQGWSLSKIKTCQSRSNYEAVLKLRWRVIHRHRHLT